MEQYQRDSIRNVLRKLTFVNWDRYFGQEQLTFFGWIERRKGTYLDFVTIVFDDKAKVISYSTSSAEKTKEIAEILNFYHLPCNRVEYFCDLINSIKEDSDKHSLPKENKK